MAIAQEPAKWTMPLGVNADANSIPDTAPEYTGNASMDSVFPPITQLPLEAGGIAPTRADFNGLFKLLGESIYYLQRGGIFSYADNVDYPAGAVVKFENGIYIAIQENGPTGTVADPSAPAYWRRLTTTVNDQYADANGNITIEIPGGTVKSVNDVNPDVDGNVSLNYVPNAVHADNGVNDYGGNWIRFNSGLQMCWTAGVFGGNTWTFPKSFIDAQNTCVYATVLTDVGRPTFAVFGALSKASVRLLLWDVAAGGFVQNQVCNVLAIGQWK